MKLFKTMTPAKKYRAHVLVAALAIVAAGCGASSNTTASEAASSKTTDDTVSGNAALSDDKAEAGDSGASIEERLAQSASGDYPEITGVEALGASDGTWTVEVTVSSPYDSAERYADAWRVLDQQGNQLAIRELTHDHAAEQPFTREVDGVTIPDGVESITVEGRDSVNGWGGQTFTYSLPDASQY